ncbi:hypothetical protein L1049_012324 [Liquidambar formosana]|uniref:Non-haem dioxygenase N-terminal domain-containing protein n=1 Tax=Liquidambar formosana TaxID=63359 RepID=A0AAP0WXL0_LIQFO
MGAVVPENLAWSLTVPSVKELAVQWPETLPRRYIRDDLDYSTTTPSDPSSHVPLIDMAKLANPESQEDELHKLHSACKDWGVFQIINHGVTDESLNNMTKQLEEFFNLPLQEKKRWAQKPGSLEGYGQAFVVSEEQKLEWNDMIFLKTLPTHERKLDFWPQHPPEFRKTLEIYSENMRQVSSLSVKVHGYGPWA